MPKISQLAEAGSVEQDALIPIVQGGLTRRATGEQVAQMVAGAPPIATVLQQAASAAATALAAAATASSSAGTAMTAATQAESLTDGFRAVALDGGSGFALGTPYGDVILLVTPSLLETIAGALERRDDGSLRLRRADGSMALDLTNTAISLPQHLVSLVPIAAPAAGSGFGNAYGESVLHVDASGVFAAGWTLRMLGTSAQIIDPYGNVMLSSSGSAFTEGEMRALDAQNRIASADLIQQGHSEVISLVGQDYLVNLRGGQSNATGDQGNPPLTRTAMDGVVMLGDAVWCDNQTTTSPEPYGSAVFNPAVAVGKSGSVLLSYAEVDALDAGTAFGEEGSLAAARMFRRMMEDHRGSGPSIVPANCAVSGRPIEDFLPSSPSGNDYFPRFPSYFGQIEAVATGASKTCELGWIEWLGHEYNYTAALGFEDTTRAGLKTKLAALRQRFLDDVVPSGQRLPPWIMYQTGGPWTRITDADLGMGMAQLEFCTENRGCYLAAPFYPVPDYTNHASNVGHRWIGAQIGKVAWNVIGRRENWRPNMPVSLKRRGLDVLISHHVPRGNLVFDLPYQGLEQVDHTYKGILLFDDDGDLPIAVPEIAETSLIHLRLRRAPVGQLYARYGGYLDYTGEPALLGAVCLRDQDSTRSPDFTDPLYNWSVAGQWPVTAI